MKSLLTSVDDNKLYCLSDIIHSLSDFDAALGRARVLSIPESPSRSAMFDLELSDNESSPTSLEGRFDFPCTPVNEDLSKQFLSMDPEEEDKMMKAAASEIAKSLDLPVSSAAARLSSQLIHARMGLQSTLS